MPTLHLYSGEPVSIRSSDVQRIRSTNKDYDGPNGATRVDWGSVSLVREAASDVAAMVVAELPTLIELRLPGGQPVWVNGRIAAGPFWVAPSHRGDTITCSILVSGKQIYVSTEPAKVKELIGAAGGRALDLPNADALDAVPIAADAWDEPIFVEESEGDRPENASRQMPGLAKPYRTNNASGENAARTSPGAYALEEIARDAYRRYFPQFVELQIYEDVPEFGGGTLFLAIGSPGRDSNGQPLGPYEYQILVKNNRGVVFTDFSQTLRQGAKEAHWLSRYVAPDAVIAVLSVVVIVSGILIWVLDTPASATHAAINSTMTAVLGYWFGRLTPTPPDPDTGKRVVS